MVWRWSHGKVLSALRRCSALSLRSWSALALLSMRARRASRCSMSMICLAFPFGLGVALTGWPLPMNCCLVRLRSSVRTALWSSSNSTWFLASLSSL